MRKKWAKRKILTVKVIRQSIRAFFDRLQSQVAQTEHDTFDRTPRKPHNDFALDRLSDNQQLIKTNRLILLLGHSNES
jgi:hypothetical protein